MIRRPPRSTPFPYPPLFRSPRWPADGRALCTARNDQRNPVLVSDGRGGALAAWEDARQDRWKDVYAQHRSEEHTSELQSRPHLVCRLLLEKKKCTKASPCDA